MGLLVAVGAKSVSSRVVTAADPIEEYADDGTTPLYPVPCSAAQRQHREEEAAEVVGNEDSGGGGPSTTEDDSANGGMIMCTAISADRELQAVVTVSYYDMVARRSANDHTSSTTTATKKEYSVAAVKVQIAPSSEALASGRRYRDSVYHVKLPPVVEPYSSSSDEQHHHCPMRPDAVFSGDRKFLSCLVPYPNSTPAAAVVVVFQLRRPRPGDSLDQLPPPPLPPYIHKSSIPETSAEKSAAAPADGSSRNTGGGGTTIIPVATNPQVVRIMDGSTTVTAIEDVSSTATIEGGDDYGGRHAKGSRGGGGPSVLLAGCEDGSILAVSYRPFVVAGVFFRPQFADGGEDEEVDDDDDDDDDSEDEEPEDDGDDYYTRKSIRQLKHVAEWQTPKDGTTGRLAAIRGDGSVSIFRTKMMMVAAPVQYVDEEDATETSFDASERSTGAVAAALQRRRRASFPVVAKGNSSLLLTIDAEYTISGCPFACAEWISSSYLALMLQQQQQLDGDSSSAASSSSKLQVWCVQSDGSQLMASWEMTLNRLLENAHTTYFVDEESTGITDQRQQLGSVQRGLGTDNNVSLHYDACSDCLAISAVLEEKSPPALQGGSAADDAPGGSAAASSSPSRRPFVCVWNWRCNVEGLVVMPANPTHSSVLSELWFCSDAAGARKLSHVVAGRHSSGYRIRKELYDASVLSIPSGRIHQRAKVQRTNFLLVGAESVSYPHVSSCSAVDDFDVEWQEAKIPSDYVLSRGSPRLAAVGSRMGKSVAVASSRGLCSLSCGEKLSVQKSRSESGHGPNRSPRKLKQTRATPRWYRFGNETEEGAFRCLAMSWWEGSSVSNDDGAVSDDILVCLVEVDDGRDKGRYLSCWAQRRFDLNHQLLHFHHGSFSKWGVRIPDTFHPVSIDLLENPKQPTSSRDRKAVVLLTDHSPSTIYRIYQLGVDPAKPNNNAPGSYKEICPYHVFAKCASSGSVGSAAEIFLASASFAFDTRLVAKDSPPTRRERDFVATIGVIRDSGSGVDALAVSGSGICAVGQVVDVQSDDRRSSEVSRYWYADFIENRSFENEIEIGPLDYCVWSLQLAGGDLICWSVPLVSSSRDNYILFEADPPIIPVSVHPKAMILGCVSSAGKTSSWMQQPSIGPRRVLSLGPVPRSGFGVILGSGQGCRKLHRSLCEDFEDHIFRPDFLGHEMFFPSEFVLSLPSFVPALFCLMSDTIRAQGRVDPSTRDMSCVFQHLHKRAHCGLYRESASMSLELLIIKFVESMAKSARSSDQEKFHENRALLAVLVEALRRQISPLQFAKLFLEVGRQIEPGYSRHLFPLPGSNDEARNETVIDLFELSLKNGALSVAVAFLPLFEDSDRIRSTCAAVFHHCLRSISGAWNDPTSIGFDVMPEERTTIGDLFRYALKVEGTGDDDSESFSDSSSTSGSSDCSNGSLGLASDLERQKYSVICGFSGFFGKRKKEEREILNAASSFISNGFERGNPGYSMANGTNGHGDNLWPKEDEEEFAAESVAGVAARFLFASAFETQAEASSSHPKWRQMAAIAALLVGESSSGCPLCSKTRFLILLSESNVRMIESLVTYQRRHTQVIGLVDFLVRSIVECRSEISREQASLALDLVLILLHRHGMSDDLSIETPGLLLLALVFGHDAGRTSDILCESKGEHPVILAYLEACFELGNSSS